MLPQVFFYFYFITNHKTARKVTELFLLDTTTINNIKTAIIAKTNHII